MKLFSSYFPSTSSSKGEEKCKFYFTNENSASLENNLKVTTRKSPNFKPRLCIQFKSPRIKKCKGLFLGVSILSYSLVEPLINSLFQYPPLKSTPYFSHWPRSKFYSKKIFQSPNCYF